MPRRSYKTLYLEEKEFRRKEVSDLRKRALDMLESVPDDFQARELMYIERIAELQREIFRLEQQLATGSDS